MKNVAFEKNSDEYDLFRIVFAHSHKKGCKSLINLLVKNHKIPSQNNLHFNFVAKADEKIGIYQFTEKKRKIK